LTELVDIAKLQKYSQKTKVKLIVQYVPKNIDQAKK
jgi:hypothetical protein